MPDDQCIHRKGRANYSKLGPDGVVPVGTYVEQGDVLIGKVARIPDEFDQDGNQISRKRDRSIVMNKLESGYVDNVTFTTTGSDGHPLVRVDIRQTRQPEVGDKFASRTFSCFSLFTPFVATLTNPQHFFRPCSKGYGGRHHPGRRHALRSEHRDVPRRYHEQSRHPNSYDGTLLLSLLNLWRH